MADETPAAAVPPEPPAEEKVNGDAGAAEEKTTEAKSEAPTLKVGADGEPIEPTRINNPSREAVQASEATLKA